MNRFAVLLTLLILGSVSILVIAGVVLSGGGVLAPSRLNFEHYRDIFPGQPMPENNCTLVETYFSSYEPHNSFYCNLASEFTWIRRIGLSGYSGVIRYTRFNVVDLRYGDLVQLFGRANQIRDGFTDRHYIWETESVGAFGKITSDIESMYAPIRFVYWVER